jgi:hypothetical protein
MAGQVFIVLITEQNTQKKNCRTPGPAYLAVLPILVIFCPLGPTVRRISKNLNTSTIHNASYVEE